MKQHTLKSSFSFEGKGLHTGLHIHATFLPAAEHTGVQICRTDLEGRPTYEAIADYVTATERGTVLERGAWKVSTVEHALSALYAMGVDNCLIEVDGPEMPILDGSAKYYIQAIEQVGLQEQEAEQKVFVVTEPIEYISERGNKMVILPCDHYEAGVTVAYDSGILREQSAEIKDLADYKRELSAARTFCFVREIEPLLRMGLIKGGDLQNALVIYETPMSQEGLDYMTDKLGQPRLDANKLGYLSPLNYPNEPARHKLLDLIGDMSLVGCRIQGKIAALRPGHTFNTQCAKRLRNKIAAEK
ncbi:MAG: UDP-3-O-acyl-N-acetylglucosamine deacetylase [Paludibacteraceae bacterium]|nr:UDP-3-O-acyl-N-acetylglucosamine deacetylase [Paludibacteraceae bacterium]